MNENKFLDRVATIFHCAAQNFVLLYRIMYMGCGILLLTLFYFVFRKSSDLLWLKE